MKQATPTTAFAAHLLLAAALKGDDPELQELLRKLKAEPKPARGDRTVARQLNEEGLASYQRREFAEAAALFSKAFIADGGDVEIVENFGLALYRKGQLDEAETPILLSLQISPERASAWGSLGQVYASQGKEKEALAAFLLAYRFSRNQKKTLDVYSEMARNDENARVRKVLSEALKVVESVGDKK